MIQRISLYSLFLVLSSVVFASGQIDIAYSPYTISQPGSYIVVKDLTTALNLDCIDIAASNITIDLNGHTLYGAGTASASSSGIYDVSGEFVNNNITVKNGNLSNFGNEGVHLSGTNIQVFNLNIVNCGSYGIYVGEGVVENNNVSHCAVTSPVYQVFCNTGSIIKNHVFSSSMGGGIWGEYINVKDNYCVGNNLNGINCGSDSKVIGNTAMSNQGDGIQLFDVSLVDGNICTGNGNAGIEAAEGCDIRNNTIGHNGIYGIISNTDCQIVGNSITYQISSSGYGIYQNGAGTRIDDNHITSNNYGIYFTSASNWYGRNTFSFNLHNTGGTAPADPGSPYTNESF